MLQQYIMSLTKYCLTIKPILMRKMKKSGAHKVRRKKVRRNLKKLSTTLTTYSPRNGKRKAAILTRKTRNLLYLLPLPM